MGHNLALLDSGEPRKAGLREGILPMEPTPNIFQVKPSFFPGFSLSTFFPGLTEFQMAPRKLETAGSKRSFPFPQKDAARMLAAQHHHADPNSWPPPRLCVSGHSIWLTPEVTLKLYGNRQEPR